MYGRFGTQNGHVRHVRCDVMFLAMVVKSQMSPYTSFKEQDICEGKSTVKNIPGEGSGFS